MREERFSESDVRRRDATQGEEEHEVDVGSEVAGGEIAFITQFQRFESALN